MIRRATLITLAAALAGGLMAASADGAAAAVPAATCAKPAVIAVKSFTFHPASVRAGGTSTATLIAVNCTARTRVTTENWFGRFSRPGGGFPKGCPVLDPLPVPARFAPHGTVTRHVTYLALRPCNATRLTITVDIDGNGKLLAKGTAILKIIQPASS
jgi:hypothetical protein